MAGVTTSTSVVISTFRPPCIPAGAFRLPAHGLSLDFSYPRERPARIVEPVRFERDFSSDGARAYLDATEEHSLLDAYDIAAASAYNTYLDTWVARHRNALHHQEKEISGLPL